MAKARKPLTPKQKEIKRIRQIVTRAQKRGYEFARGLSPKSLTRKTLKELKELTPEKVYAKGKYVTPEGKKISGTEARKLERSKSAKKSAETRKAYRTAERRFYGGGDEASEPTPALPSPVPKRITRGEIEYQNMIDTLNYALQGKHEKVAKYIYSKLQDEIATYGRDAVIQSIGENPAVIQKLQECMAFYDPRQNGFDSVFDQFMNALTGEIPDEFEILERDELFDYIDEI